MLVACLLALLAMTGCAAGGADGTLIVINGAGGALCSVRVKKASSQTFWGRNRLRSGERLEPGASLTLDLPAGYYDADAHLCDDETHLGFGIYDIRVDAQAGSTWVVGNHPDAGG
ncbi:MAG TPA: hypothetical protein PKM78_17275 [Anaerolineae bacterium]|nr:hypothetical protein [Anaerolineae bacterium]